MFIPRLLHQSSEATLAALSTFIIPLTQAFLLIHLDELKLKLSWLVFRNQIIGSIFVLAQDKVYTYMQSII